MKKQSLHVTYLLNIDNYIEREGNTNDRSK